MKQLIMLMLALTIVLGACGKKEETTAPKVEVKVNKADEAKKKIAAAKKRGEKKDTTTEESTTEDKFDTDKYNKARECLLGDGDCSKLVNTEEYSRAWNNLTNEGYICQNGSCKVQPRETPPPATTEAPATTETVPEQTVEPSTEAPVEVQTETPVQTEAPVQVQTEVPLAQ